MRVCWKASFCGKTDSYAYHIVNQFIYTFVTMPLCMLQAYSATSSVAIDTRSLAAAPSSWSLPPATRSTVWSARGSSSAIEKETNRLPETSRQTLKPRQPDRLRHRGITRVNSNGGCVVSHSSATQRSPAHSRHLPSEVDAVATRPIRVLGVDQKGKQLRTCSVLVKGMTETQFPSQIHPSGWHEAISLWTISGTFNRHDYRDKVRQTEKETPLYI